jgi:hypothetical protein
MRTFEYDFNGSEVTIKIFLENGSHICDAKFPTPAAARTFAVQDVNWHFSNNSQSPLTESEQTNLVNLVLEKTQ